MAWEIPVAKNIKINIRKFLNIIKMYKVSGAFNKYIIDL